MISDQKPEIVSVIQAEGVELRRRGNRWWGCCPLHEEQTPSFCINDERQTWHCFGACSTGGDVIDLIRKLRGIDFKEACRHLGIEGGRPDRRVVEERELRRRAVRDFEDWRIRRHSAVCAGLRAVERMKLTVTSTADFVRVADAYHATSAWEHELSLLEDDEAAIDLYQGGGYGKTL